jgi:ketosteroid isomerase-like protein
MAELARQRFPGAVGHVTELSMFDIFTGTRTDRKIARPFGRDGSRKSTDEVHQRSRVDSDTSFCIRLKRCRRSTSGGETPMSKLRSQAEARNLELVEAGFEKWKSGTGGPFDLLAPTAQWTIVGNSAVSGVYPSKAAFMKEVIAPFNARMSSPLVPSMRGLYADDDMVIALFDGSGTARDGKSYRNTYSWYMRMSEGQIVEVTAFFDSVEFNDFWARVVPVA